MMRIGLPAAICAAAVLSAAPARADQIVMSSGMLDLDVNTAGSTIGSFSVAGDRGFTFSGSISGGFQAPLGDPLPPGSSLALDTGVSGLAPLGTLTLDGLTYTRVGGLESAAQASMRLTTSSAILPSTLAASASITAPFRLDMMFFPGDGRPDRSFVGTGTATISLGEDLGFEVPSWTVTGVRATLSSAPPPVPEPATLLLLASGVACAAFRRRRTDAAQKNQPRRPRSTRDS